MTSRPCYRQRVTYDVICLSDEPDNKYRTVLNVTGSDDPSFSDSLSLCLSVSYPMNNSLRIWVPSGQISPKKNEIERVNFVAELRNGNLLDTRDV